MPMEVSPSIRIKTRRLRICSATPFAMAAAFLETRASKVISLFEYEILPVSHHLANRSMNVLSEGQSFESVQIREKGRPRLSRDAPVLSSPTSPGHCPEKLLANSSGESLPTTPSVVCGA